MYAAWLLAFGLLLWGQGNLWNADYGVLTGDDIDLTVHASARVCTSLPHGRSSFSSPWPFSVG